MIRYFVLSTFLLTLQSYAQTDGAPPFADSLHPLTFRNGNVQLSAHLILPKGKGPFPAVVMVHGAGPSVHDEPAFRIHANAFVRGGFAVMVYDKRGSGNSSGQLDTSDYDVLAQDCAAGIAVLRQRNDIRSDQIGILGRSAGGWVGTLAAAKDPSIRFVILSSGSGVRPWDQTVYATQRALHAQGASIEEIDSAVAAKVSQWKFYRKVSSVERTTASSIELRMQRDSIQQLLHSFARFAPNIPQGVRDPESNPVSFFRAFTRMIEYDPYPAFLNSKAALLEVIGADDEVIETSSTVSVFERLRSQKKEEVRIQVLPGVGHSLVLMTPNGPRYPEDYPEMTVRWALSVIGRSPQ